MTYAGAKYLNGVMPCFAVCKYGSGDPTKCEAEMLKGCQ
jgi:hypothetical protein